MKKLNLILLIIGMMSITLVVAQTFTLPSTFTINPNFAGLPTPQPNQKILGCTYAFPIEIRDVKIYGYSVQGQNVNLNASFSLYTDNKKSACSIKQRVFTVNIPTWQQSLASLIVTTSQNNINTTTSNNNPISIGGLG